MKFRVQLRTTREGLERAIEQARIDADESTIDRPDPQAITRSEAAWLLCAHWFRDGEVLTVEFDTDSGTCVVLKSSD